MIVLYNPLSTTPGKQPLPLSLMALAAVLDAPPGGRAPESWTLVDGNIVGDPAAEIIERLSRRRVRRCRCSRSPSCPAHSSRRRSRCAGW
jgi:hypothetical protein